MRSGKLLAVFLSLTAGALAALSLPQNADAAKGAAHNKDGAAEVAANAFLASLPTELRAKSAFPVDSPERLAWHYIPKDRIGVSLLELDDTQSELLHQSLVATVNDRGVPTAFELEQLPAKLNAGRFI